VEQLESAARLLQRGEAEHERAKSRTVDEVHLLQVDNDAQVLSGLLFMDSRTKRIAGLAGNEFSSQIEDYDTVDLADGNLE
jgi:hypothetical protein